MKALLDDALSVHQTALNLRAQRQELLASNIANADTPNYKARDLDFRSALDGALGRSGGTLGMTVSAPGHLADGRDGNRLAAHVGYRQESQSAVDGNTVNMDVERAAFAENSLQYEASLRFVDGVLSGMRTAIRGE